MSGNDEPIFILGELFAVTFSTPAGWLSMSAEVKSEGTRLILDEIALTPLHTKYIKAETAVLFWLRGQISTMALAQGYTEVEINGLRTSGRSPCRIFRYVWRLV